MSASSPPQLDAATLIERISTGQVPRDFVLLAAKGFLPLAQDDVVAVLAHLTRSDDGEVSAAALQSLKELPPRAVASLAANQQARPEDLDALANASSENVVLEAILRNRNTSDATIEALARRVPAALQEVIVINQERILRHPLILEALLENKALTADARRRAIEIREEFFEKKRPAEGAPVDLLPEEPELELTPAQEAELQALLEEAGKFDAAPQAETDDFVEIPGESRQDSAFRRIMKMTVSQKVMCAFRGGLTERSILIRSRSRLVCTAVMRSPRITESEVENFAAMRNLEDEVLRIIGMNRQWMSKYSIMSTLVKNPKAPLGVVLPLINRLNLKDLKSLSSDKGVSEAVRQSARKLYVTRRNQ